MALSEWREVVCEVNGFETNSRFRVLHDSNTDLKSVRISTLIDPFHPIDQEQRFNLIHPLIFPVFT